MKTQIHNLQDEYIVHAPLGSVTHFSGEMMAWNSITLILLAIAALMVLVNRLKPDNDSHNRMVKFLFGGLSLISLAGVFYPIQFGLIGVNVAGIIILIVDFFKYDKNKKI